MVVQAPMPTPAQSLPSPDRAAPSLVLPLQPGDARQELPPLCQIPALAWTGKKAMRTLQLREQQKLTESISQLSGRFLMTRAVRAGLTVTELNPTHLITKIAGLLNTIQALLRRANDANPRRPSSCPCVAAELPQPCCPLPQTLPGLRSHSFRLGIQLLLAAFSHSER